MSLTTLTINGIDYTSYATVAEADAYLAVDPTRGMTWAALSVDAKSSNLIAATRRLDLLDWSGERVSDTQDTDWPRTGATCNGNPVSSTGVPIEVEQATILVAGSIALDSANADAGTAGSNIQRVRAGTAEVEFFRPTIPGAPLQDTTAFSIVSCLLGGATASSALSGKATGTDGRSSFDDVNYPDLREGYP